MSLELKWSYLDIRSNLVWADALIEWMSLIFCLPFWHLSVLWSKVGFHLLTILLKASLYYTGAKFCMTYTLPGHLASKQFHCRSWSLPSAAMIPDWDLCSNWFSKLRWVTSEHCSSRWCIGMLRWELHTFSSVRYLIIQCANARCQGNIWPDWFLISTCKSIQGVLNFKSSDNAVIQWACPFWCLLFGLK